MEDICNLNKFDDSISEKVLSILLAWSCYGQNEAGIKLGRSEMMKVPKVWLKEHLLDVIKKDFDYDDEWNYRRLLELVVMIVPGNKKDILELHNGSINPEILEVIKDFS